MILATADLPTFTGRVTMVDGGFDPLHPGHLAYFRAAAALGLPVLCNVTGDHWVTRKHVPLLPQGDRVTLIDGLRWIDLTHGSETLTTGEVLLLLRPRFYAKGADWRDRLPEHEVTLCRDNDIEIVFLDTVQDSSTRIIRRFVDRTQEAGGG